MSPREVAVWSRRRRRFELGVRRARLRALRWVTARTRATAKRIRLGGPTPVRKLAMPPATNRPIRRLRRKALRVGAAGTVGRVQIGRRPVGANRECAPPHRRHDCEGGGGQAQHDDDQVVGPHSRRPPTPAMPTPPAVSTAFGFVVLFDAPWIVRRASPGQPSSADLVDLLNHDAVTVPSISRQTLFLWEPQNRPIRPA